MALCGGRSSRHAAREEELEKEHDLLESEVSELREALEKAESELPRLNSELSAVETRAASEATAADEAEKIRTEFMQELNAQSAIPAGSPFAGLGQLDLNAQDARDAPDGEYADGIMPLPPPPLSPRSRIHRIPAVEHHTHEANRLAQEIASHQSELAELKRGGRGQLQMLESAESVAMQVRSEVTELRGSLGIAEEEGRKLAAEHRQAEADEEPLREWVQHVETELRLARTENADLSSKVAAELSRRTELQNDEADARPLRRAGVDIQQVHWLQEHERSSIARKAALAEEIAAQRFRRKTCLEEAKRFREEAAAEERLQDQYRRQKSSGRGRGGARLSASSGRAAGASPSVPSAGASVNAGRLKRLEPNSPSEFLRDAGSGSRADASANRGWLPPAPPAVPSPSPPMVEAAATEARAIVENATGRKPQIATSVRRRGSGDESDGGEDGMGQRLGYWDTLSDEDSGQQWA